MLKTVEDVCKYIGSVICDNPICVETGSTYCIEQSNLVHTTTNNISNFVCLPKNGTLFSVDIDKGHQDLAKTICDEKARTIFLNGDSVACIRKLASDMCTVDLKVDLLWLDSKEFDVEHAMNEYMSIYGRLAKNHFVCVDDIHNSSSVKWVKVVPILKSWGYSYIEVPTPTGLFFATRGYALPS